MSDPIVSLPPDHWIVKAWEKWRETQDAARLSYRISMDDMWNIFAAGAQSIPGNPERIAELERELQSVQLDGAVLALQRSSEEHDSILESHTNYIDTHGQQIVHLDQQLKVLIGRVDIAEKTLAEAEKTIADCSRTNFIRWTNLDAHVERCRDEYNGKFEDADNKIEQLRMMYARLAAPDAQIMRQEAQCPLVIADSVKTARDFAEAVDLRAWAPVTNPDALRGIDKKREFYVVWPLTTSNARNAYEEWISQ